ncbi:tricarballylate utilization 4Fe-4S protein TcuB [Gammaproteobacteria bacterium]|nr:tricarballylate utilization 4Fe-4S protein TcuB [Gammaproteobacteria bacterium]
MTSKTIIASSQAEEEARRMLGICNACRYCEGFCAVFPAMTKRQVFNASDLSYLGNLCHNCNACYHGCQYVAPHQFQVNIPKTMAELRGKTYEDFAWPKRLSGIFRYSGLTASLTVTVSLIIVFGLLLFLREPGILFQAESGPGSFYQIVSHQLMIISATSTSGFAVMAIAIGLFRYWRHCKLDTIQGQHLRTATKNVAQMTYLGGDNEEGCNDIDESFSNHRRYYHQAVMWGFLMCFASTCVATFYDYVLNLEAPYDYLSFPVLLGTVGGIAMLVGCVGLFVIKWRSDPNPRASIQLGLDYAFIIMLFLSSATGLILMILRETKLMPILLAVHLAVVLSLFVMLPYSKFVHAGYRFISLIKYAQESQDGQQ